MIKKLKNEYKVVSEKTGRNFGSYGFTTELGKKRALTLAKQRLREVEFFKHKKGE
jgi:hypothetical protein